MDTNLLDKQHCLVYVINQTDEGGLVNMGNNRPDIITLLENEKSHCQEQLKRINIALKALKGEIVDENGKTMSKIRSVQWKANIKELFKKFNKLATEEIIEKLAESGVVEALEDKGKNSIYATVSRLTKDGFIARTEDGGFQIKRQPISINKTGENLFRPSPE